MNNCNENYDKIIKKLEEERRKCKICYIRGPKGDKGDKGECGPASISIGDTITTEANTKAKVENIGTNTDVILTFYIPKGQDGTSGDEIIIGNTYTLDANARAKVVDTKKDNTHTLDFYIPQGFDGVNGAKGEPGQSDKIKIVRIITLDPEEEAQIEDNFDGTTHNLTISLPKGEKGDIGPAGSAALESYASLYEDNGNSITLKPNVTNQVELGKHSQNKNVNISFTNAVKIKNEGIYKIDYFYSAVPSDNTEITLSLRKENNPIAGTKIIKKVTKDEQFTINGSIIIDLNKDDLIDLGISSQTEVTLTPKEETIATLNLMKID